MINFDLKRNCTDHLAVSLNEIKNCQKRRASQIKTLCKNFLTFLTKNCLINCSS